LRPVFEAFGTIDHLELHKEPSTGKSKGFGFVTFKNEADAKQALQNLNGLEIAGRPMKVGVVHDGKDDGGNDGGDIMGVGDLDEGDGGGLALSAGDRVKIMRKLLRGNDIETLHSNPTNDTSMGPRGYAQSGTSSSGVIASISTLHVPKIQPSTCVIVKNMFDPREEKDPDFHLDIKDDVEAECKKKFGALKHIFVDKHSQGHVYLRFTTIDSARKAIDNLNNRWFASKQITAEFIVEATYLLKFPEAK